MTYTEKEVHDIIMDELKVLVAAQGSQEKAAEHLGFTGSYISSLINGSRRLSKNIIAKFGFERVYVRKV